jgi:hypothetical protein
MVDAPGLAVAPDGNVLATFKFMDRPIHRLHVNPQQLCNPALPDLYRGSLGKKMGLKVESTKSKEGERSYSVKS